MCLVYGLIHQLLSERFVARAASQRIVAPHLVVIRESM